MLPVIREVVDPGRGNEPRPPPPSETVGECSRTNERMRPDELGRQAEEIPAPNLTISPRPAESHSEEQTGSQDVEMDPAIWGELQHYIDVELVAAQLPLHAFYTARRVCKRWECLPRHRSFLEKYSTTRLPKPYFVLYGKDGCHQAALVKDVVLNTWELKQLPSFPFQDAHTCVAHGLVLTCWYGASIVRGTVFNIHTKVFHRLPPLVLDSGGYGSSQLAVDKHSSSYKVLVACSDNHHVWVYDSMTGVWTQRAPSPKKFYDHEDATYVKGVMYMKWSGDIRDVRRNYSRLLDGYRPPCPLHSIPHCVPKIFGYDFKDDVWTVLPMTPPALVMTEHNTDRIREDQKCRGLGEWRGALRDVTYNEAENVLRVWGFEQSGQQWLEVDRMPANLFTWLFDPSPQLFLNSSIRKIVKTSYCEQYILITSNDFPSSSGLAKLVLYDMALRSWETPNIAKNWVCPCPYGY